MRKPRFWLTKTWNWQTKIEGCVKQTKLGNWQAQKKNAFRWRKTGLQNKRVCGRVGDRFLLSTCPQFQGFVPLKTQEGARKIYKNGKRWQSALDSQCLRFHRCTCAQYIYIHSSVYSYIRTYIGSMSDLRGWPLSQKNVPIQNEHLWLLLWHMPHGRQDPLP